MIRNPKENTRSVGFKMVWRAVVYLVCLVLSGCRAQNFYSCGLLASVNCTDFPVAEVCGTNGQTYDNRCVFGKAHCQDPLREIHLKYEKSCDPLDFATTPHPTATAGPTSSSGGDVVLNIFCAYLLYKPCPPPGGAFKYVCATDGRSYGNYCEFEKEKCTHRELHVHTWGNCTN